MARGSSGLADARTNRARKEGRRREELAKVEVLPHFEHFGGIKARLGLALTIAFDELAQVG